MFWGNVANSNRHSASDLRESCTLAVTLARVSLLFLFYAGVQLLYNMDVYVHTEKVYVRVRSCDLPPALLAE